MNKMSLLLFGLSYMLKNKPKKKAELKKKLEENDLVLQIKTASASTARYYIFSGGEVFSKKGVHLRPSVALVWKDEAIAFKVMTNKDPQAMMKALGDGSLKIEGKAELALWFAGVVKMMMG
jgi:hypothetical protein